MDNPTQALARSALRQHGYYVSNDGTVVADPAGGEDGFYLVSPDAAIEAVDHLDLSSVHD